MAKERIYRAVSTPILTGENRGKRVTFMFVNDDMELARHHAQQVFSSAGGLNPYGPADVEKVSFLGVRESADLGKIELI